MRRRVAIAVALLLAAAPARASWLEALFAPRAALWAFWSAHDPAATRRIDHAPWSRFLATYRVVAPDGIARVAYARVSASDRAALDSYVAALAATPVRALDRGEQRAYWINLYNALTVQVVLQHYPVASIRDIDGGVISSGPWGRKRLTIEGQPVSLDDIEHRILRPIWRDPRLHYALNCASLGCPNLAGEAFTAANAERLLDDAARAYVNHPRGLALDGARLTASSIYRWFREDFGGSERAVLDHLRRYAAPALAARLADLREIDAYRYDWSLNDAR
jgi:hypothetical protein